ncbi:MAG: sugar ABC transporter substrate-binding protein [Candidatus Humimicrobiaceae bacterium]
MKKSIKICITFLVLAAFIVTIGVGCKITTTNTTTAAETTAAETTKAAETTTTAATTTVAGKPMEGWTVGYLPGALIDVLRKTWSDVMIKTIEDAGGKVITIDSQNDATKQVSDGEDILQQDIKLLIINPNDADAMVPIIKKANEKGIPVICIDRAASGGTIVTTVEFDNYKAGFEAGKFIAETNNKKGKVMQIQGTSGASVVYERGQSFRDAIKQYPEMKIVDEPFSKGWTGEDGLAFTEDILRANPDLIGIWTHADAMAVGAYQAVLAAGKLDQVTIVGMGFYGGMPELIKEGKSKKLYTWALLPDEVGKAAGEVAIKIAMGKTAEIKAITATPIIWITPENVDKNWELRLQ